MTQKMYKLYKIKMQLYKMQARRLDDHVKQMRRIWWMHEYKYLSDVFRGKQCKSSKLAFIQEWTFFCSTNILRTLFEKLSLMVSFYKFLFNNSDSSFQKLLSHTWYFESVNHLVRSVFHESRREVDDGLLPWTESGQVHWVHVCSPSGKVENIHGKQFLVQPLLYESVNVTYIPNE